ncbi:MAG: zinc-dependent alcohol dehydrogenase [Gaiellaceae bacterium]
MLGLTKIAPGRENVGLTQRPEPVAGTGHVVLAVQAAGVCGTDLHIVDDEFASSPPVTMGHEVCGVVVEIGPDVDPSWLGERVVSETYFSTCGACEHCRAGRRNLCHERRSIGSAVDGAFAPRLVVPVGNLHRVRDALASEAAALTEPLACVCQSLCDPDRVSSHDRVLVVGPGPIGLIAAQVARTLGGLVHVRGLARDATRLAKAAELGFETSVDGDLGEPFDVVVDCSGHEGGIAFCLRSARRGGRLVQIGLAGRPVTVPFDEICYRELTVTGGNASTSASWRRALALLESGAVDLASLVTEVVPLVEWERAFSATRVGLGVKFVLDPREPAT